MKRFFLVLLPSVVGVWIFSGTTQWRENGSSLLSPTSSFSFLFFALFILRAAPNYLNAWNRLLFIQCASQAKPSLLRTLITTGCEGDWAKPENNRNLWVMLCRAWYRSDLRAETASKIGYPGPIILHWCTVLRIILICCWPTCNIITSNASDTVFSMRTWAAGDKKNCRRFGHWQACTVELESILLALAKQWRLWTFLLRTTSVLIKAQYPRHYQWLCHK